MIMEYLPHGRLGSLLKAWLLLCTCAASAALWETGSAAHPGTIGVTWNGTTKRILQNRCVGCHGSTGVARPRLDDYEEARLAAPAIKDAVLRGHLPRWYAAPGFGEFGNDPTLTPHEVEMLAQWADGRAPRGEEPRATADSVSSVRPLQPGLLLSVPYKHRVTERSHTFELATGLRDDEWIRGWVFEPGNASLVSGAVIALSSGRTLGTWSPGDAPVLLPERVAYRLPAQSSIRLTVYYERPEGPAVDASRLGLYFARGAAREVLQMALPCGIVPLPRAVEALSIRPVPTSPGTSLAVLARRPDRSIEPLAWLRDYPDGHTRTYRFRDAVSLPKGTLLEVSATGPGCMAELEYVASGREGRLAVPWPVMRRADRPDSEYWCAMHADVRATAPGACDRCGMPLVPVRPHVDGGYWLDARLEPRGVRPGQPATLRLVVREPRTRTVVRQFETVHERPFHLFVVSEDLQEFSHVHPSAQPDGSLALPLELPRAGSYRLFADFLPVGGTPQMIGKTVIVGTSALDARGPEARPLALEPTVKTAQGMRIRMHYESGALVAGDPSLLAFTLEDAASGLPIDDLEPFLGAWGHMFIVGNDLSDAVHSHPTAPLSTPPGSKIYFHQRFPKAGSYRLWAQFQRAGSVTTVAFTVDVIDRFSTT